jgi:hypothetical protein
LETLESKDGTIPLGNLLRAFIRRSERLSL